VVEKTAKVVGAEVEDRGAIAELGVTKVEAVGVGAGRDFDAVRGVGATAAGALAPGPADLNAVG
jgi:hypothetical protein